MTPSGNGDVETKSRKGKRKIDLQLRRVYERTLHLEEEARRRIASELYNSTSQELAALRINLGVIRKSSVSLGTKAERALADCLILSDKCCREIRTLSHLLHPPMLDEFGLISALRDYAGGYRKATGIRLRLTVDQYMQEERLPKKLEATLFRIVQEALANVRLHSGSRTALIELRLDAPSRKVVLHIADHGHGLPSEVIQALEKGEPNASPLGIGLCGMHERVTQLGGNFQVQTGRTGTALTVSLPARRSVRGSAVVIKRRSI
jgi:two-component system NarL family sensor kinase